jgi:fructose transport system substrate-binding protein
VGGDVTMGSEEGDCTGMENMLQRQRLSVVHTINKPAAAAYEALKAFGMADGVLIVSVDGGRPGMRNVAKGIIGATSMQFPLKMASMGVKAVVEYAKSSAKPQNTDRRNFFDTGAPPL